MRPAAPYSFKQCLFTLAAIAGCLAAATPARGDAEARLRKLLTNLPQTGVECGAMIVDLQTGRTVYARDETRPMVPASNQKILVLATAADMLGREGAYRTVLAACGDDLVVIGDGDPGLGDPRLAEERGEDPLAFLDRWAAALKERGRTSFAGDMVVDATILDGQFVHPDWEEADLVKWYGAPVGGLNLNDNCVDLTVRPGGSDGNAVWEMMPPCSLLTVENRCRSTPGKKGAVPVVARRPGTFELVLSGEVGKEARLQSVSVPEPNRFAATAIRERLGKLGITVAGELRFQELRTVTGHLPEGCEVIADYRTPLADVMARIGLHSQNMFAEALLKRLGYEWVVRENEPPFLGSWENGRKAVNAFLKRAGCDASRVVVADGSGLSRTNRISAADFVCVLRYMHGHPQRNLFLQSLAGNQTGGSLKRRVSGIGADVYAKTGYMRGIRSLSGYVRAEDDRWFAFSVLFNGFRGSSGPYNEIHNKVCEILAETADAAQR